jgi:Protein of unknown function (DUF3892)
MAKQIHYVDKGGDRVEHITHLGTATSRYTRRGIVRRMEQKGKKFYTEAAGKRAYLTVAKTADGDKYVRTQSDSTKKDNLLALPKCPPGLKAKKD